jgi:NAD(P)-dependent dehydrogenase (short-subunit alcohol dehydrogenase family)
MVDPEEFAGRVALVTAAAGKAPYASSKGGLAALSRGLAHDGGPHGIRAVYVSMGIVKGTKFVDDNAEWLSKSKPGPLGDVPGTADIAEAVAFLRRTGPRSSPARC